MVVTRKISDLIFEVKGGPKAKTRVLHHDRLKPYNSRDTPTWALRLSEKIKTSCHTQPPSVVDASTQCSPRDETARHGLPSQIVDGCQSPSEGNQASEQSNASMPIPWRSQRPRKRPMRYGINT